MNFNGDVNQNMSNNKKNLIMPIISLAVFMVFIFGATYAYYTTSVTATNNTVINANLDMPSKAAGCTIVCDKSSIVFNTSNITTANMLPSKVGTLDTQTITCTATYGGSGSHTAGTKCQFDVSWNWVSTGANIYNTSANNQYNGWSYRTSGTATCTKKTSDTNIPAVNTIVGTSCYVSGSDTATQTGTFIFSTKFANQNKSQDVLADKVFRANVKILNAAIVAA